METAVLKVMSDVIDAADTQKVTLLGLLDMSAAFDTVDHKILLERFEVSFGVKGLALAWLLYPCLCGRPADPVSYTHLTLPTTPYV